MKSVVIGLGFGDEGKGLVTSYLCEKQKAELVVRFNGGHQAGHTVVLNGTRHVFSSFGSGTLQGVPTYWGPMCTIYPTALMNELRLLKSQGIKPVLYVDSDAMVTTPMDVMQNRSCAKNVFDGTVGVGFGQTVQRNESHYSLRFRDLFYDSVVKAKLQNIKYCHTLCRTYYDFNCDTEEFLEDVREMLSSGCVFEARNLRSLMMDKNINSVVFEGAQGVLLDQHFGFFPNVTRSNTTSENAVALAKDAGTGVTDMDVYYVTRSYCTRHGNGYMPETEAVQLTNNENETNSSHSFQGTFRTCALDRELLRYALACDEKHSFGANRHLVVTCTDQHDIDVDALVADLGVEFKSVLKSNGPCMTDITRGCRRRRLGD